MNSSQEGLTLNTASISELMVAFCLEISVPKPVENICAKKKIRRKTMIEFLLAVGMFCFGAFFLVLSIGLAVLVLVKLFHACGIKSL